MRLFAKEAISETTRWILRFQQALLDLAENNKGIIMPGYTHLQHAQPVLLTHHLLAYFEMTDRDKERFRDCLKHTDVLPLGSGALAGVPYPVDREFLARELGFSKVSNNSIDAVSDRDFVVEYEMAAAITMMHLSRLAEELVLWSSAEFGFIKINSVYTTGSSIMPQKKNPDVAELARGKTGRIYGHLVGILTAMKALPLSYNRDMQEDKEGLFDTADTLVSTLEVLTGMVKTLEINARRLEVVTREDFILATDIADYLTKKGVPFRESHKITRELVAYSMDEGKSFHQLTLGEYQKFSPLFQEDVFSITADSSVAARDVPGGTAPRRVEEQLARARRSLEGAG
jgi:argininosuccinate lyase